MYISLSLFFFFPFNKQVCSLFMAGTMDHSLGQRMDYVPPSKISSRIERADWKRLRPDFSESTAVTGTFVFMGGLEGGISLQLLGAQSQLCEHPRVLPPKVAAPVS